jgi:hypothetical protein
LAAWLVSAVAVAVVAIVLRRMGRGLSITEGSLEKGRHSDFELNVST